MQLGAGSGAKGAWAAAGYTDDLALSSWKTVLNAFAAAFPSKPLVVDLHPMFSGEVFSDDNGSVAGNVVSYGNSTIGTRFGVIAGWWSQYNASTGYSEMFELLKQAAMTSFGMVQFVASAANDPEAFTNIAGTTPLDALTGAIDLALNNGVRYVEIWNVDIRHPEFQLLLTETGVDLSK